MNSTIGLTVALALLTSCVAPKRHQPKLMASAFIEAPGFTKPDRTWGVSTEVRSGDMEMNTTHEIYRGWSIFIHEIKRPSTTWGGAYVVGIELLDEPMQVGSAVLHVKPVLIQHWPKKLEEGIGGLCQGIDVPGDGLMSVSNYTWTPTVTIEFTMPYHAPDGLIVYVQALAAGDGNKIISGPVHALQSGAGER